MVELIFWISVAIPLYAFAGYPLVLLGLGLVIRREVRKAPIWPLISLLIPAYNEARVIARKIDNTLALDYPADRIEIVIVSDGSSDETVDIARSMDGVRVLALPKNHVLVRHWAWLACAARLSCFPMLPACLRPIRCGGWWKTSRIHRWEQ